MNWGNAIVTSRTTSATKPNVITSLTMSFNLTGDYTKTSKKITWLAPESSSASKPHPLPPVDVILKDYDYLITKKKLDDGDDAADFVTPVSEFKVEGLADGDVVLDLKKGDVVQFERKGFYVLDDDRLSADRKDTDAEVAGDKRCGDGDGGNGSSGSRRKIEFIRIPDGKAAGVASKAAAHAKE